MTAPTRGVLVAAWAFPVMVLGQFALLAGIPAAIVLARTLRSPAARWWSALMTTAYVVPLSVWLLGPATAPSLSKSLSPVATGIVAAAGAAAAAGLHFARRRATAAPATS
ncbi:hypothetical protein SAMN05421837_102357 [Amycolatopsis pretoriensis]|uniref:Uncharacterized protein n=1 Tax=Amycolatopsis pretoriensis TaxID=218821 RepID=A0A1H5QCV9_9PSEU|nr:hypothetical protein [Amycolatopsis pretoriensis]SEF23694.1 hypothetical protein SAMN05421837_102357 [Amycolatopsis pretoriensis]